MNVTSIAPCKTKKRHDQFSNVSSNAGSQECVFPFKYRGVSYDKCTKTDSDSNTKWCALDIQPNTEVSEDGKHWGVCEYGCSGVGEKSNYIF